MCQERWLEKAHDAAPNRGRSALRFACSFLRIVRQKDSDAEPAGVGGLRRRSYVKAFEEQNHCKVSASYMGSSDELVAKLRGGSAGTYDVISPSSDVATMIASSGLATPLDLGKLPAYGQLSPQLTSLSLVRVKGDVYGVPFMWGPDPMIYDTTAFASAG